MVLMAIQCAQLSVVVPSGPPQPGICPQLRRLRWSYRLRESPDVPDLTVGVTTGSGVRNPEKADNPSQLSTRTVAGNTPRRADRALFWYRDSAGVMILAKT